MGGPQFADRGSWHPVSDWTPVVQWGLGSGEYQWGIQPLLWDHLLPVSEHFPDLGVGVLLNCSKEAEEIDKRVSVDSNWSSRRANRESNVGGEEASVLF